MTGTDTDTKPQTAADTKKGPGVGAVVYAVVALVLASILALIGGYQSGRADERDADSRTHFLPAEGWKYLAPDLYARTFTVDGRTFTCFSMLRSDSPPGCVANQ